MSPVSAAPRQSPCTTPHAKQAARKEHAERNGENRCAGGFDEAGVTKLLLQGEPVIALAAQPLNEAEAAHVVNIIRRAKTDERSKGQRGLWHAACGTRRLQHGCVVHACCPHLDAGNGLLDGRGHVAVALQRHSFLLASVFRRSRFSSDSEVRFALLPSFALPLAQPGGARHHATEGQGRQEGDPEEAETGMERVNAGVHPLARRYPRRP